MAKRVIYQVNRHAEKASLVMDGLKKAAKNRLCFILVCFISISISCLLSCSQTPQNESSGMAPVDGAEAGTVVPAEPKTWLAAAQDNETGLCGYIDEKGAWVIRPQFREVGEFGSNGLARVRQAEYNIDGWAYDGFIDTSGSYVLEPTYCYARDFSGRLARIMDKNTRLYGFIDEQGNSITEPQFLNVGYFSRNGLAAAQDTNNLWGFINKTGDWVVAPSFSDVGAFCGIN